MAVYLSAPHPANTVTVVLPSPEFGDGRAAQQSVQVRRSMLGRVITYVKSSDRYTLTLPFQLTRQKSLELENFVRIYYRATWQVILHDDTKWSAKLVGGGLTKSAVDRIYTGNELVTATLELSATRI